MAKTLIWDLETSNLNADFGYIICASIKEYGSRVAPKVYSVSDFKNHVSDPTNDKELVKKIAGILSGADVWVTWYGKRFDLPYLDSRLLHYGYNPMPRIMHIDGWETSRSRMRLHSNRLASVTAFLGCENKTPLSGPIWIRASAGHKPSIKYVMKHCVQDVLVLEQAYKKMVPLIMSHPNVRVINNVGDERMCPRCGAQHLIRQGIAYTAGGHKQRYQCNACGGWATGKPITHKNLIRPE